MNKPANPPADHHYIPRFLLSQWAIHDGRLWRFSKPHGQKVDAKLVSPKSTGFQRDLYSIPGLPNDKKQLLEQRTMQAVDSHASRALKILLGPSPMKWTSATRSGWSRFLLSLWHRTPENLAAYKEALAGIWDESVPEIQEKWEAIRKPGDPEIYEDFARQTDPDIVEKATLQILSRSLDNPRLGQRINNMRWDVLNLSRANRTLLISDDPIVASNGIGGPGGHIVLAISPTQVFVAANEPQILIHLSQQRPNDLVRQMNLLVVQRAYHFVGAADPSQRPFIEKHFGSKPAPNPVRLMAEKYRKDGSSHSPLNT